MPPLKNKVKRRLGALRDHWNLARRPGRSALSDTPILVGMLRGAFPKPRRVTLGFPSEYAYKFRYLHRGLSQLALLGGIQYTLRDIPWLGRKTAIITMENDDKKHVTAVIDGADRPYKLGDANLDLERVFGSQPRVLFKLTYSEILSDPGSLPPERNPIFLRSSRRQNEEGPPIAQLYQQVLDGAYWPINPRYLDETWVRFQQGRDCDLHYDLMAFYSLNSPDVVSDIPGQSPTPAERMNFLLRADELKARGLRVYLGAKLMNVALAQQVPQAAQPFVRDQLLDYDSYLDAVCQSHLQYCPKNFWQENTAVSIANRTYRLLENLALGRICLSSEVKLHFSFVPGVHYICVSPELSNLAEVVTQALENPKQLEEIRRNTLDLYDRHLSPMAIARHYVDSLDRLLRGEIPLSAWSTLRDK